VNDFTTPPATFWIASQGESKGNGSNSPEKVVFEMLAEGGFKGSYREGHYSRQKGDSGKGGTLGNGLYEIGQTTIATGKRLLLTKGQY